MKRVIVSLGLVALAAAAPSQDWTGHARVDGRVLVDDHDQDGVKDATVSFRRPDGAPGPELVTGPRGHFSIDGIASGDWSLVITAPGFEAGAVSLHLPDPSSWLGPVEVRLQASVPVPAEVVETAESPESPPATTNQPLPAEAPPSVVPPVDEDREALPAVEMPAGYAAVRAALARGRVDRALALAAQTAPDERGSAELFFDIGRGFLKAGETEEALLFFDRALDEDPHHLKSRYARALGLLALGQRDAAREDLEAIRDVQPDTALGAKARQALAELTPPPPESP